MACSMQCTLELPAGGDQGVARRTPPPHTVRFRPGRQARGHWIPLRVRDSDLRVATGLAVMLIRVAPRPPAVMGLPLRISCLRRRASCQLLFATAHSWPIAIVRVTLGVIFSARGSRKVLGWFGGYGLKGTTEYLVSTGLPRPMGYLVCFFEFLGGLGLLVGLLTRLEALDVISVRVGAIATVHARNGFFPNWELTPGKGHGYEANLAFVAMAVARLIAGGGRSRWIACLIVP